MIKCLIFFICFVFGICMTHLYLIHYSKILKNKLIHSSKLLEKTSLNQRLLLLNNKTFLRRHNKTLKLIDIETTTPSCNCGLDKIQELQKSYGPLRYSTMTLAPEKCNSFAMAFPRAGTSITANSGIWDTVLEDPKFRWKYPVEEGYAVDAILQNCVPENGKTPLVLDAGANMGYFSLAAAACGCAAIAYEPNEKCQDFIGASIALNDFDSVVRQRRVAVTDVAELISFDGWGTATYQDKRKAIASGRAVQGIKLDDDVRAMSDSHYILYLKVDIQGSEHDAIRGSTNLLAEKKVRFVAYEAQLRNHIVSSQDVLRQLCGHGYECFDVQNPRTKISCTAGLTAYRDLACETSDKLCERYLMCAHESSHLQMVRDHVAKNQKPVAKVNLPKKVDGPIFFFGTRPEIIKMIPVIKTFKKNNVEVTLVFTGQHETLVQPFLEGLEIDLRLKRDGSSLNKLTSSILSVVDTFGGTDWFIQGDTTSAFTIALAGFHLGKTIHHIEAGLRTFDIHSPFPEEFNRKTISSIASVNYCPTDISKTNLKNEGIVKNVYVTGNTVIDYVKTVKQKKPEWWEEAYNVHNIVVVTLHRREQVNKYEMYKTISLAKCTKCIFIVPVHPNPTATKPAKNICDLDARFKCVDPLPYPEMQWLINHSHLILSDSGGLQEEASWYKKPILVLRNNTERPEGIYANGAVLVTKNSMLNDLDKWQHELKWNSLPFGDGCASDKIYNIYINRNNVSSEKDVTETFKSKTVGIVLQVYKRIENLDKQIDAALKQTMKPDQILVVKNGLHSELTKKREGIMYIESSGNLKFHGRFHLAYLLNTDYVSVWDDDVIPSSNFVEQSIKYSKEHGYGLVGANGRTFSSIVNINKSGFVRRDSGVTQINDIEGRVDFVGHIWTLPRPLLKYYISQKVFTHSTGEDIQLAYALQKQNIYSYNLPKKLASVTDLENGADQHASWRKDQSPRELLFCEIIKDGFQTIQCKDCLDVAKINKCIEIFKEGAIKHGY